MDWKQFRDTPYEVSNTGLVRRNAKILKPQKNSKGYLRVQITNNKQRSRFFVHRMVAELFVPNPDNKPQVNHKDGNKLNNHYTNLECVTPSENYVHGVSLNLYESKYKGEGMPNAVLTEDDVKKIRATCVKGHPELGYEGLGKKYGVSGQHIKNIVLRKKWKHVQ